LIGIKVVCTYNNDTANETPLRKKVINFDIYVASFLTYWMFIGQREFCHLSRA